MSKTPKELIELAKLRAEAMAAVTPNDNMRGPWLAKHTGAEHDGLGGWSILGPKYKSRPSRMIMGEVYIDGITHDEAKARSKAVAEYMVACVNTISEMLDELKMPTPEEVRAVMKRYYPALSEERLESIEAKPSLD